MNYTNFNQPVPSTPLSVPPNPGYMTSVSYTSQDPAVVTSNNSAQYMTDTYDDSDYKPHHWLGWGIAALLLIGFIIWIIIWATSDDSSNNKELVATGVNFSGNQSSVTATWNSTANTNDELVLYAAVSPLSFDSAGNPTSTGNFLPLIYSSESQNGGTTPSNTGTVTISVPNQTTWNVYLVVTNPEVRGSKVYNDIVHTTNQGPLPVNGGTSTIQSGDIFVMSNISQKGSVRLNMDCDIVYDPTTVSKSSNDVFLFDEGIICLANSAKHHRSGCKPPRCGSRSDVLYNNNGTLAIERKKCVDETQAMWSYNVNGKNEWCLTADASQCLTWTPASDPSQSTPVTVSSGGTPWVNTHIEC